VAIGSVLALIAAILTIPSSKVTPTGVPPLVCERCGAPADASGNDAATPAKCMACNHEWFVPAGEAPVLRRKADRRQQPRE
jgi:hypothetical protein